MVKHGQAVKRFMGSSWGPWSSHHHEGVPKMNGYSISLWKWGDDNLFFLKKRDKRSHVTWSWHDVWHPVWSLRVQCACKLGPLSYKLFLNSIILYVNVQGYKYIYMYIIMYNYIYIIIYKYIYIIIYIYVQLSAFIYICINLYLYM